MNIITTTIVVVILKIDDQFKAAVALLGGGVPLDIILTTIIAPDRDQHFGNAIWRRDAFDRCGNLCTGYRCRHAGRCH